ncbi:MAG: hypothetical protein JWQ87_4859 [Candidatus Sulfotelmatobacter sp.]|nr:hypothetical protein [Candidatus Sulfotelmatobacter sp.]
MLGLNTHFMRPHDCKLLIGREDLQITKRSNLAYVVVD